MHVDEELDYDSEDVQDVQETLVEIVDVMKRSRTEPSVKIHAADRMMEEMLYDLRMHYVRGIRGETGPQGEE